MNLREKHIELWTKMSKYNKFSYDTKQRVYDELDGRGASYCFACDFVSGNCSVCPVDWCVEYKVNETTCFLSNSLYHNVLYSKGEEYKKLCIKIANAWKERGCDIKV